MALAFIEDTEPLTAVESYYKIHIEDYRPTASEKEKNNGIYEIHEE